MLELMAKRQSAKMLQNKNVDFIYIQIINMRPLNKIET